MLYTLIRQITLVTYEDNYTNKMITNVIFTSNTFYPSLSRLQGELGVLSHHLPPTDDSLWRTIYSYYSFSLLFYIILLYQ